MTFDPAQHLESHDLGSQQQWEQQDVSSSSLSVFAPVQEQFRTHRRHIHQGQAKVVMVTLPSISQQS